MTRDRFRPAPRATVHLVTAVVAAIALVACHDVSGSNASRERQQTGGRTAAATTAAPAPAAQSSLTENCTPCTFKIGQSLPDYALRFTVRDLPDDRRIVDALQVSRADGSTWTQSLQVHGMTPIAKTGELFISAEDINFDGYNDLSFATSRGVANTYADYWVFDPRQGTFRYLGNYPIFKVDPQKGELSTYERGGDGGMIYKSTRYAVVNGAPTVVASEEQEKTELDGVYRKSVFQLRDGQLALVKRENVRAPK